MFSPVKREVIDLELFRTENGDIALSWDQRRPAESDSSIIGKFTCKDKTLTLKDLKVQTTATQVFYTEGQLSTIEKKGIKTVLKSESTLIFPCLEKTAPVPRWQYIKPGDYREHFLSAKIHDLTTCKVFWLETNIQLLIGE